MPLAYPGATGEPPSVTTISSLALRVFPGRHRTAWALSWRTDRSGRFTDRRLHWGYLALSRDDLQAIGYPGLLRAVADQMEQSGGHARPPEGAREPLGAVGGGSHAGLGLPGIDPDE